MFESVAGESTAVFVRAAFVLIVILNFLVIFLVVRKNGAPSFLKNLPGAHIFFNIRDRNGRSLNRYGWGLVFVTFLAFLHMILKN